MEATSISPQVRYHLARAIDSLKSDTQVCQIFWEPVDHLALEIPDYPQVIARPMCLLTLKNALQLNMYKNIDEFLSDSQLIFNNCRLYNYKSPFYVNQADRAEQMFCQAIQRYMNIYLNNFSLKTFKLTKYDQNVFDIYSNDVKSIEVTSENYQQILRKISHLLYSMPYTLLGEVVDYYLRCKKDLISYGEAEIEFKFEPDKDNWLMGNICLLLENKLVDGNKRGL